MVTQKLPLTVDRGPYRAILHKARKHHRDALTQEYIYPDEQYYSITMFNCGLRSGKINAPKVRPENLVSYFIKRETRII